MSRRRPPLPVSLPSLDRSSHEPLQRQLVAQLREAVLAGRLAPDTAVPSTRALAAALGVSRNTVLAAYDQLTAEGYLVATSGSATRVAELPQALLGPREPAPVAAAPRLSQRAAWLTSLPVRPHRAQGPLAPGALAVDAFPFHLWGRLIGQRWRRPGRALTSALPPAGLPALRAQVAAFLASTRAVRATPDQVLIVSGSQQALDLVARVLLDPGDVALVEDPGYHGLHDALAFAGARPLPIPVDAHGFDLAAAGAVPEDARLACVTPSHQFPLGMTLPLDRRLALLDWARRRDAWLLEDDYDADFRYAGRPLASLQSLDPDGRTLYTGTFSRATFASLRLGYLVVPDRLLDAFLAARRLADTHPSSVAQAALADFMAEGHYEAHLRRLRALYTERRGALHAALAAHLPDHPLAPSDAGVNQVVYLPPGVDDLALVRRAAKAGLAPAPLSTYYAAPAHVRPGLILGFAATPASELPAHVGRLAACLAAAGAPLA